MSIVMSINVNSWCLETKIRATPYKNIYKSREVLFVPQKNAACCIGGQNKKELMEDKKRYPFGYPFVCPPRDSNPGPTD